MCKLCNTDSAPAVKTRNRNEHKSKEFKNIALEYTGEYPCNNCISFFLSTSTANGMPNIDSYIIARLKRCLLHPILSKQQKLRWKTLEKRTSQGKLSIRHGLGNMKEQKIEKYITKSSHISYTVLIQRHFIKYKKVFNTLEEAQAYKKTILEMIPTSRFVKPKSNAQRRLCTVAEKGISKIFTPSTGYTKYEIKTTKIYRSFKTLEEARQFKQEMLNGNHNQHNPVAA